MVDTARLFNGLDGSAAPLTFVYGYVYGNAHSHIPLYIEATNNTTADREKLSVGG